jgi:hypothetical protein
MRTSRFAGLPLAVLLCTGFTQPARAQQAETVAVQPGYIQVRLPRPNSMVKPYFEFAGRTAPHSVVTIEAYTNDIKSGYEDVPASFMKRTRADAGGTFSVEVVVAKAQEYVHVHVQSVAPDGSSAQTTESFAVIH